MSVKITDHTGFAETTLTQRAAIFLRLATDEVVKIAEPKTPASAVNPRLKNDVLKQALGLKATIKWNKAYAGYQEAGERRDGSRKVKNYTTPGTGPHFAENAVRELLDNKTQIIAKR